jgi:long-chain acyl-CoA synthetase
MKLGMSGGGPLSSDVQTFCRICFGFPLIQGYALTESCCAGCVQLVSDSDDGIVGAPLSCVELKLEDCPDIDDRAHNAYMTSDTKHWDGTECAGRGEVLIRGPSVSLGYYAVGDQADSLSKKTIAEFSHVAPNQDEYHWFHTGDIALFTPDGRLKIVDRKKNLVKLKGGEYIAVEQMEAVYGTSKFIDAKAGGIMVHGDGDIDRPVALIQANMPEIKRWAKDNDIKEEDSDALCQDPKVMEMVLNDLIKIGKGPDGVARNEILCAIALISGTGPATFPGNDKSQWTPENGFLTASNKIDRNSIKHGKEMNGKTSDDFSSILQGLRATKAAGGANSDLV